MYICVFQLALGCHLLDRFLLFYGYILWFLVLIITESIKKCKYTNKKQINIQVGPYFVQWVAYKPKILSELIRNDNLEGWFYNFF